MQQELLDAHREAMELMNRDEFEKAAKVWEYLLSVRPDWENGNGAYNLATCYEEAKRADEAANMYREALRFEPDNPTFLGGYAAFLYLNGRNEQAFEIYARLFERATVRKDAEKEASLSKRLIELGQRLGLSESDVRKRLRY